MEIAHPLAEAAALDRDSPPKPLRLLVGYDGRPGARDALALAGALAAAAGAELTVASVRGYRPATLGDGYRLLLAEDERWVSRGAAEVLGGRPFAVRVLAGGHEAEGLCELADAENSDLIVLGSAKRGPAGRVCLSGIGRRVLSGAPCAVAVAPRGLAGQSSP